MKRQSPIYNLSVVFRCHSESLMIQFLASLPKIEFYIVLVNFWWTNTDQNEYSICYGHT
jgi:hypothetical protein